MSVCLSLSLFLCLSLHLSASVLLSSIESKIKSAGLTFQAKGDYGYSLSASSLWLPWATMERYVFQTNPTMLAKSTCMGTGISRKLRHCAGTHSSQFLRSNKVADMSVSLVGRWHAGINTDTHRHTHTHRQTDKQTDRQTHTLTCTSTLLLTPLQVGNGWHSPQDGLWRFLWNFVCNFMHTPFNGEKDCQKERNEQRSKEKLIESKLPDHQQEALSLHNTSQRVVPESTDQTAVDAT